MDLKLLPGVSKKSYVVHGAELSCTMGTAKSTLQLPIGHGVFIHGKKQANTADFKPLYNILPFCNCKVKSMQPCIPVVTMNWLNGKSDMKVDEVAALLDTSIAICSLGGVIKITDDGQM